MHLLATWSEIAAAVGTLALAGVTAEMVRQTRRLVEHGEQPVVLPDPNVQGTCDWVPGGASSTYWLPIRNVGQGVTIIPYRGGATLLDPPDVLSLPYPGSAILGPGEATTIELRGTHMPVPRLDMKLLYSDVGGKRFSQTIVPYVFAPGAVEHPVKIVPLQPTFTHRVKAPARPES